MMRHSKELYDELGYEIYQYDDGYKVRRLKDNWKFEMYYPTKYKAQQWIDFVIDNFVKFNMFSIK